MKLPTTGIEIWDGLPGSGKTYSGVFELVRVILEERRPVYTNMPIRWPVLRRFLDVISRSGHAAKYAIPLGREHLFRFVTRNHQRADALEAARIAGIKDAVTLREFERVHGPDICEGPKANWFYPGAVIILDEFHRWADARKQKQEDPSLLTWATMHRHHLHRIIILTQDKMQVSLSFRRNAVKFEHFTDKRQIPFLFGIKLPFTIFCREEFPAEMLQGQTTAEAKPISTRVYFPTLKWGGALFRVYESFSHVGGVGRLMDTLDSVRRRVEGGRVANVQSASDRRAPVRWVVAGLLPGLICGAWLGPRVGSDKTEAAPVVAKADGPLPKVAAVSGDRVRVDGKWVSLGGSVGDWKLEGVTDDGTVWKGVSGAVRVVERRRVQRAPVAGSGGASPGASPPAGAGPGS